MGTRLGALDAAFLHIEDRSNRMQLAGVLVFEGATPSFAAFRAAVESKLPSHPPFRQRLAGGLGGQLRPSWIVDAEFDLDYHLRRTAVPAPGGREELLGLVNELTSAPLDLQRPLWEMTLVEGLGADQFGIALKVHHCMVDGLSIMQIFATLFSADPASDRPLALPAPPPRVPEVRSPLSARLGRAAAAVRVAPRTRLNTGPSGPTRATDFTTVPLEEILRVRRAFGTTVNNVVLATVTGALRRYLDRHDELVDEVYAFVPVNRRTDAGPGFHGNRIGMTYPALPVGEADPSARVRKVVASVDACVRTGQADDTAALLSVSGLAPEPVAAALNRLVQFDGGLFNLTVTNVPGPPVPVYFLGRRLLRIVGSTPLTRRHALTVAVLSYAGELTFSVTTDPRRLPDGSDLVVDLADELALLSATATSLENEPTHPTTRSIR
jgi:hypothetical protein